MKDRLSRALSTLSNPLLALAALALVLSVLSGDLIGDIGAQEPPPDKAPSGAPAPVKANLDPARYGALVLKVEDIEGIEDPIALEQAGLHHLKQGDKALAKACFEAMVVRDEINHYVAFGGTPFGEAVVLERMGDWEASRGKWREMFKHNVMDAYFFMKHYSRDAEKVALEGEAVAHIKAVVEAAKRGEKPNIYTTSKGEPRPLEVVTMEDALKSFEAGEKLSYAYIEELDLSGKTFAKRVGCARCVVGSIKGYGSTFGDQLDFRGVVLGDVHLGKKWEGEVNKSASVEAATFNRVYLDQAVILGNLNIDSIKVTGRVASFPLTVVEGEVNMRNADFNATAEFRFTWFGGKVDAKGAEFHQSSYFGHTRFGGLDFSRVVVHNYPLYFNSAQFAGPVLFEKCELMRGATFEDSTFADEAIMRQCRIYDRLNFSRSRFGKGLIFSQIQLTDLDFLGTDLGGDSTFNDCVFSGNVRFSLDGLTRRLHLKDVTPLHKLYKQYQGDDDADSDLTTKNQYGVIHVDDLTAKLLGNVSFANTIFQKFVNFEGVQFGRSGTDQLASFFNTQFYGEAHFERTQFFATADFRTIFGNEVAFNDARFHKTWMLDDANVPGRLSMSGAELIGDATISFYGARVASFGITFGQLIDESTDEHRLFYEQCAMADEELAGMVNDERLFDARWDSEAEAEISDAALVSERARKICLKRAVQEFVVMKDSFSKRGMGDENDWAFWHMRHYKNRMLLTQSEGVLPVIGGALEWLFFEKGFGWGVRLSNLLWTSFVVVLIFIVALRLMCGNLEVEWDGRKALYKDLDFFAEFMISVMIFLGRTRDWKASMSDRNFKVLYLIEVVFGIILITFFIGAYTRLVLR